MRPTRLPRETMPTFEPGMELEYWDGSLRRFVVLNHDVQRKKVVVVTCFNGKLKKYLMHDDYFKVCADQTPVTNE